MVIAKALIIFIVTAKQICASVFAFVKCWFSHDAAHFNECLQGTLCFVPIQERTLIAEILGNGLFLRIVSVIFMKYGH